MLVRPSRRAADRQRRARAAASARQRRYRARLRAGAMPIMIEIGAATITMLIATEWLAERDAGDRAKIAAALTGMIADTAAKFR